MPISVVTSLAIRALGSKLRAPTGDTLADQVLAQIDFVKTAANFVDAIAMDAAGAAAIDLGGALHVVDTDYHRALELIIRRRRPRRPLL